MVAALQSAGTRSAKRHLVKLSGRERRFHHNVNHVISKKIVAKPKTLEKLLRSFIEYKAALAGVPVILVNPRGTSHICPVCGHNERGNRPNRDTFRCMKCGLSGCADHIAAINIAFRAAVNQPIVSGNFLLEHICSPQGQTPPLSRGA